MIDIERKYEDSPELTALAKEIVEKSPQFEAARDHPWKIVFVNKPTSHYGGRCRKLDALTRFLHHLDFVVEIWHQEFEKLDETGKLRLICHELWHMSESDEGAPRLRKHWGDFCELPAHDTVSMEFAAKIKGKVAGIKSFPQQTELAPTQRSL